MCVASRGENLTRCEAFEKGGMRWGALGCQEQGEVIFHLISPLALLRTERSGTCLDAAPSLELLRFPLLSFALLCLV